MRFRLAALPSFALAVAAGTFAAAATAAAQTSSPQPTDGGRVLTALRVTAAPRIDGRLDEADWQRAQPAGDFVQAVPRSGAPASERTEVRVLYDQDALYVGFRAYDSRPDSIASLLARRDANGVYTDWLHVAVDSYHDRRTAWRFSLNPRGVQGDGTIVNDTERDALWDAVWQGASTIDALGWTAEFRIPLSQLRFTVRPGGDALVWGINFTREIARRGERAYWSPTPPDQPGVVSRMGTLVGLDSLNTPGRLELMPYARAQLTRAPGSVANPFYRRNASEAAVGLDLRYRLPANLTLSTTINPDFGQVEADPAVVNLSAFEQAFPERRPFFLEGADVFRFGGTRTFDDDDRPNFFYTRRIGRAPTRRISGGDVAWVDAPLQTPILGAAKVSGKTQNGWSVGALGAATREQTARYVSPGGVESRAAVEPTSGYGIVRARRDLRGGNTVLGVIATGVERDLGEPTLAALLPNRALAGGVDFEHAWGNRTWSVSGVLAATHVAGEPAVLVRLQRAAYRLYQRPDADYLDVDSARRSLAGQFVAFSVAKTGGQRWLGSSTFEGTSPGFETNDLGFQQRADRRTWSNALRYRSNRIGTRGLARAFREYEVTGNYTLATNFGNTLVSNRLGMGGQGTLRNFWKIDGRVSYPLGTWDDRLTRGGPMVHLPTRWSINGGFSTDSRRRVYGHLGGSADGDSAGRRGRFLNTWLELRPSEAIRLRLAPTYSRRTDTDQYIASLTDVNATTTYGRRYVFAETRREEIAAEMRADWTFTPRLSLQLFARPFASRGRFTEFTYLSAPERFGFTTYGPSNVTRANGRLRLDPDGAGPSPALDIAEPNFAVRALRGNAVVRWEFRPGSALFVVWQQARDGTLDDPYGAEPRRLVGDVGRSFGDVGRDVFLVKVSRYIGR